MKKGYFFTILLMFCLKLTSQIQIDSSKNIFQNTAKNAAWIHFCHLMKQRTSPAASQICIVQLGDSHIQGGFLTTEIRNSLISDSLRLNRGWVFPYKFDHSNGQDDVVFSSTSLWCGNRYDKLPSGSSTRIAGYKLVCDDTLVPITIRLRQGSSGIYSFNSLTFIHNSPNLALADSIPVKINTIPWKTNLFISKITWKDPKDSVGIRFRITQPYDSEFELYDIILENSKAKCSYHSIGTNGLTFSALDCSIDFSEELKFMHPDLVIISLGTNDAIAYQGDSAALSLHIDSIIHKIRQAVPECCLLLTTAGDFLLKKNIIIPGLYQ